MKVLTILLVASTALSATIIDLPFKGEVNGISVSQCGSISNPLYSVPTVTALDPLRAKTNIRIRLNMNYNYDADLERTDYIVWGKSIIGWVKGASGSTPNVRHVAAGPATEDDTLQMTSADKRKYRIEFTTVGNGNKNLMCLRMEFDLN